MAEEANLDKYLKEKVTASGGYFFKMHPYVAGTPDRLVLLPYGQFYLIELKSSKGRQSAIQKAMANALNVTGHEVTILSSKTEVDAFIKDKTFQQH